MKKLILIMTALTLSLSMALAQEAGPKGKPGGPGGPGQHDGKGRGMRGMEKMLEQLNLTDKQKAQIKEILEANRPKLEKGKELTPEQRREKMMAHREELHKKIRAVLNAEQKVKFDKMLKEMKERMEKRGDRPGKPGKPGGKKGGAAGSGNP